MGDDKEFVGEINLRLRLIFERYVCELEDYKCFAEVLYSSSLFQSLLVALLAVQETLEDDRST